MTHVRRAAVAGRWYPADRAQLAAQVDDLLSHAEVPEELRPKAIIAPHAGLVYSGPVAAYTYKTLRARQADAVVLVGPSHFVPFAGVSIWPRGAWDTPFGQIAVEQELAAALQAASGEVLELAAAHSREHSIEMQLPFVARLLPGVPIVPMVMGHQTRATAFAVGEAVARAVRSCERDVLLIASSDLSHYEDACTAARLDRVVLDQVEAFDAEGLMGALETDSRHACGGGPMVAVMEAALRLGASTARVLRYADSGDVSGDKSSVVGYMAAAIW